MYTYLLIDIFVIIIPLVFTFHKRLNFHRLYPHFFISTFIVGVVFLVWDIYFTNLGYWGFNPDYITGINLFSLPLEEVLFFFCIPYACVFSYHVLEVLSPLKDSLTVKKITYLFSLILFAVGLCFIDRLYTSITFVGLSIVLLIASHIVNMKMFYRAYLILLLPFILTDGLLTGSFIGREIVWYNNNENLGVRLLTIPIEDIFYGMLLLLLNVIIYEVLRKSFFKSNSKN
jgi:lycopene cyclase domain-containing protein